MPRFEVRITSMHWYCIHTKPRREEQVAAYLAENLGIPVFLPQLRRRRQVRRAWRMVDEPLFPQYLFARFELSLSYRAVKYTHDVSDVVHVCGKPAVVSDGLLAELRLIAADHVQTSVADTFAAGDNVEILDGPMRGLQAVILEASDEHERVAILLSILGCAARVTISRHDLLKH